MKKVAIGCLAVVGAIVVIGIAIGIINTLIDSEPGPETTTATTGVTETYTTTISTAITASTSETEATSSTITTTETSQVPAAVEVELIEAVDDSLIELDVFGTGSLDSIMLILTPITDDTLEIAISSGTVFVSQSTDISGMIIATGKQITLKPNETAKEIYVDAASTNMPLDVPGSNDTLVIRTAPINEDLMKLCPLPDFQQGTFRIQQFAIWTVTDNPRPDGYARIGFGLGSGPSDEEMAAIEGLFTTAGIQMDKYLVFQAPVYVELIDASSRGLIMVSATGAGSLEVIKLSLTSLSDESLEVAVLPGTIFNSQSASIQSMLIIKEKLIVVYPHETVKSEVDAACANMVREVPGSSDVLTMSNTPVTGDLAKLLNLPEFNEETYRVRQFAIWTITDNPARGEYIGIGFILGTPPNNNEMERIRYLFERADISTEQYQALS